MRIDELFGLLASTTWKTICGAAHRRISFGEDAFTSINLNAISSFKSGCVAIQDTRAHESKLGCDFEMWIGDDRTGWSRYAVQAKKLTSGTNRYDKLQHFVGGKSQIDILDAYARSARAAAIYCLYNYASGVSAWNCSRTLDPPQLGCSVTPSLVVRDALKRRGARSFASIHSQQETIPWRCLLTCSGAHRYLDGEPSFHRSPTRWPDPRGYFHENLPEAVNALRRKAGVILESEDSGGDDLEGSLVPGWVVVVDTAKG